jgi:peroxiredoxin Q/BCP
VVLFFYPKAGTPGCTKEVCSIKSAYAQLAATGAAIFGISSDDPATNKAFADAHSLPFPLLTDPSGFLRKSFEIKGDLLGLLPGRQTIVIDKAGVVVKVFNSQFDIDAHVSEALSALKAVA